MKVFKIRKNYYPIKLVVSQLVDLGLHLGHSKKVSLFLNSGLIHGYRRKQALLQMRKSLLSFLQIHFVVSIGIRLKRAFWFTSFDEDYMGYTTRYALLTGQALYINNGIFGSLSNFRHINRRGIFLKYIGKFHNFKKREKNFVTKFSGLLRSKKKVPFAVFIIRLNELGVKVSGECGAAKVVSTALVDSNSHGVGVMIPVPGNDDSLICVLFYLRFLANLILYNKIKFMKLGKKNVLNLERNKGLYKEDFLKLVLKKKQVNYKKFLLDSKDYYFLLDKLPYGKSIESMNLSGMRPDIHFIYLDTLLPRKDETTKMFLYTI